MSGPASTFCRLGLGTTCGIISLGIVHARQRSPHARGKDAVAGRDLSTLVRSIDDMSTEIGRIATVLLPVCLVFLATIIETSHQDLLLNTSKPVPHLGVRLPLVGVFTVAPVAIAILHVALLLQARELFTRLDILAGLIRGQPEESRVLDELPSSLLVRWVAAPLKPQSGLLALSVLVWLTLVVLPLGTLVLAQLRFLPFHDPVVTWLHRGLVIVICILVVRVVGVPWGRRAHSPVRLQPRGLWAAAAWVFAATAFTAGMVLTVPDEWLERRQIQLSERMLTPLPGDPTRETNGSARGCAQTWNIFRVVRLTKTAGDAPRKVLCATYLASEHSELTPRFMRRNLVVRKAVISGTAPSDDLVERLGEGEAWRVVAGSRPLAGRDLRFADLSGAHLIGINLRGADLRGARLAHARLDFANLGNGPEFLLGDCPSAAEFPWDDQIYCRTLLDGADLTRATLVGASLFKARLGDAKLDYADLRGAELNFAELDGTSFQKAKLAGASLAGSRVVPSTFFATDLSGAQLSGADLEGLDLSSSDLTGRDLVGAILRWPHLGHTDLRAADLRQVRLLVPVLTKKTALAGADLRHARIVLSPATLDALRHIDIAGADLRQAKLVIVPSGWVAAPTNRIGDYAFEDEIALGEGVPARQAFAELFDDQNASISEGLETALHTDFTVHDFAGVLHDEKDGTRFPSSGRNLANIAPAAGRKTQPAERRPTRRSEASGLSVT